VSVNTYIKDLLGYTHRELLRKKLWELGFLEDTIANQRGFKELLGKEYTLLYDLALQTKDGRRLYAEFSSTVYMVGQKKMLQCTLRNASEKKKPKK